MANAKGINTLRGWGQKLPGQYYPGVEAPGNPDWEKRNPLPIRQVPTRPITTPVVRPTPARPPAPAPGMEKMPKVISDMRSTKPYTPYKGK